MSHNPFFTLISCVIFGGIVEKGSGAYHFDVLPDAISLREFVSSKEFESSKFGNRWDAFYNDHYKMNATDPLGWALNLNYILKGGLLTNSTVVLRSMLELENHDSNRTPIFDPDRTLYMVAKNYAVDDEAAGLMTRVLMEYGAVPMRMGFTNNPLFAGLTVLEVAIRQERPTVVQALLMDPSPLQYDTLEAMADASKDMRQGIEIYRTKVIREATDMYEKVSASKSVDSTVKKSDVGKLEAIIKILKEEKFYIFAETYLNILTMLLFFVIVVVLLIQFLFHLRIKRIPTDSQLSIPRPASSVWWFALHFLATLLSTVPSATLFQTIAMGIGFVGSLVWSGLFTARSDIFAILVISALLQTLFTLICYYTYAPVDDAGLPDDEPSLVRVMFYPKSTDWSRAVSKSTLFIFSCSVSLLTLFTAIDPTTRMYMCPALSISDTYGFKWSWFRVFTICWDIVTFFTLTLRIQRAIETVTVYDLIGELIHRPKESDMEMTEPA